MTDLGNLMKQAQKMQENIQKAQEDLAKTVVNGTAGGGLVTVVMTGRYDVQSVKLDDSLMQENKDMVEDLVAAAFNDAVRKVEGTSKGKMAGLMSGMNLPEGFNFPGAQ